MPEVEPGFDIGFEDKTPPTPVIPKPEPYKVTVSMEVEEFVFNQSPIEFDKTIKDEVRSIAQDLVEFWLAKYLDKHPEVMPVIKGEKNV
jgi:hypothetical protein